RPCRLPQEAHAARLRERDPHPHPDRVPPTRDPRGSRLTSTPHGLIGRTWRSPWFTPSPDAWAGTPQEQFHRGLDDVIELLRFDPVRVAHGRDALHGRTEDGPDALRITRFESPES